MRKTVLSSMACLLMVAALVLAGCGQTSQTTSSPAANNDTAHYRRHIGGASEHHSRV